LEPADDLTLDEMLKRMHLIAGEKITGLMNDGHLIDDFVLSRNVARYGLKYTNIPYLLEKYGRRGDCYLYHQYLITEKEKAEEIEKVIKKWGLHEL